MQPRVQVDPPAPKPSPGAAAAIDDAVRRVCAGDREAFRTVIASLEAPLRVLVGSLLPRGTPVDDLVQEAFISAYLRLDEYRLGTDFGAWIRTLARHIAQNERRLIRRRRGLDPDVGRDLEERMSVLADQLTTAISTETRQQLRDCMAGLADAPRRLIEGFYWSGLSTRELALHERRAEPWVRVMLYRTRAALARCLDEKGTAASG